MMKTNDDLLRLTHRVTPLRHLCDSTSMQMREDENPSRTPMPLGQREEVRGLPERAEHKAATAATVDSDSASNTMVHAA